MASYREDSYILLNEREDEETLAPAVDDTRLEQHHSKGPARSFVTALVVFILVDVLAYLYIARVLITSPLPQDPAEMEFRNPYFGLEHLYRLGKTKPSKYSRLLNAPRFTAQVTSTQPNKVSQIDPHRWLSDFGLLSPPDRRLQVSNTIHTVAHFNVLDFGMEKCSLAVRLPTRDQVLPHPQSFSDANDLIHLGICKLNGKRPLNEREISWNSRPKCESSLGTLVARIGEEVETPTFFCKSGDFLTYEISCSPETPYCGVDVWSNQNATLGVFIYQYQSLS